MQNRPIHEIAAEIFRLWQNPPDYAKVFVEAMTTLSGPDDMFGAEEGRSIVAYFLTNAGVWRGPDARRIKAELKKIAGVTL